MDHAEAPPGAVTAGGPGLCFAWVQRLSARVGQLSYTTTLGDERHDSGWSAARALLTCTACGGAASGPAHQIHGAGQGSTQRGPELELGCGGLTGDVVRSPIPNTTWRPYVQPG